MGRGVINLVGGGELTLVNVHDSSGNTNNDAHCRPEQFKLDEFSGDLTDLD